MLMRLLAPAKVNLCLRVGAQRNDGFHPLMSWMCTVGLFDSIACHSAPVTLSMQCDRPDLPTDERNLVMRAARLLREHAHVTQGAQIRLEKVIPSGAGLGGGSSDAARTLVGLCALWGLDRGPAELLPLAARLGSDVPFFLFGPSSLCTGRGEIVRPVAPPAPGSVVLILPPIEIPTPAVYRRFDEMLLGSAALDQEPDGSEWSRLGAKDLLPLLVNDLEPAAFSLRPDLADLRQSAERVAGRIVRMSGSGSSLFTLFDDMEESERAARQINESLSVRTQAVRLAPMIEDDLAP